MTRDAGRTIVLDNLQGSLRMLMLELEALAPREVPIALNASMESAYPDPWDIATGAAVDPNALPT